MLYNFVDVNDAKNSVTLVKMFDNYADFGVDYAERVLQDWAVDSSTSADPSSGLVLMAL